ncbi:hypothetical protein LTR47_001582 [Exophiala xenobiotica]|nr:hypothetical protein LTR41_003473 [Exophiala xenobiotica]KAK5237316.1 hypothetical protein LTR47_001582 [Exophiala xenobiotica]KAK5248440.1 hypothetical protein LTS06_006513 [Exophiala xenobiotica]KAK5331778.1 hypothetical protein LTR93_000783 [Exophiala xenobiotica]KAK5381611.1 hypothetical protein LTR11_003096 [Exophiala xenobiotica]
MDVLSVESCVQTVIGAYHDASKLVQRLQQKATSSQEFILPDGLVADFKNSLSLGCITVQSQYDHDVRRFGETYARGDATAREQMKDIVISIQRINTHLREVFMDDTSLNLHIMKETSDDGRVNATVCLGQLYQRMSTAAASMKQMSRSYQGEAGQAHNLESLAYSSSQSTQSSLGGKPWDSQSAASYTTYGTRTAVDDDRKLPNGLPPQRRISLASGRSYSSEAEPLKSRSPGENNLAIQPLHTHRHSSQGAADTVPPLTREVTNGDAYSPRTSVGLEPSHDQAFSPLTLSPLGGQVQSSLEPALQQLHSSTRYGSQGQVHSPPRTPLPPIDSRASPSQVHELDDGSVVMSVPPPRTGQRHAIPLNPDYSTLECVVSVDVRGQQPLSDSQQQYMHYVNHQTQLSSQQRYHNRPVAHERSRQSSEAPQSLCYDMRTVSVPTTPDTRARARVPTMSSVPRPLSIRSSSSAGSKIGGFVLKKALPPGIVGAMHKTGSSSQKVQNDSQPRYVKPKSPTLGNHSSELTSSPVSTLQNSNNFSGGPQPPIGPVAPSLETLMRAPASPYLQVARSELNLPSESNLAGFCKGAIRQQLGGRKKGFSLEHKKPAKGHEWFFQCTKCNFAGPATVSAALPSGGRGAVKREKTYDTRIRVSPGGIKYRWTFLAKSHVLNKASHSDLKNSNDVYGCYFCCAEGAAKGWLEVDGRRTSGGKTSAITPTFDGLDAFLAHLDTHRLSHRIPGLIVANELNCIVGRGANDGEDFDLNLPLLAG